jgi:hypothetical protein
MTVASSSFMFWKVRIISFVLYQVVISQCVEGKPIILSIPYQVEDVVLSYHPSAAAKDLTTTHSIDELLHHCERYSFPGGSSFMPDKLELSQRNKLRDQNDSTRLCVLDKSRLHYKIFTVPKYVSGQVAVDEDVSMT